MKGFEVEGLCVGVCVCVFAGGGGGGGRGVGGHRIKIPGVNIGGN